MKESEKLCPRLIEVALPIREISAESVRDNLIDIINYCAMAIMVIEEEQDGK